MLIPLSFDKAEELRCVFKDCGFHLEGIRGVLGINEFAFRQLRNLPRLLHDTRGGSPLHLLMRLFCFCVPVESEAARRLLPKVGLALLEQSGLVIRQDGTLVPQAMLTPFEGFLIATDGSLKIEAGGDPEAVLVINPTTWLLHRFSVRRASRATLDLGAGCGALALAASRYSESVVATDLNPRATEFAAFNARLNGCGRIECLTGDSFEPVSGRTFDLILTNPPFFVSPSSRYKFCDNDLELDQFCRRLVRSAKPFLNQDGILQMVCEWVEIEGEPWKDRIAEWVEETGCDAWVMRGHSAEPDEYACQRIKETTLGSPEGDAEMYSEWMSYYRERRVRLIHRGLIALRRRDGQNWIRFEEMPAAPKEPFGDSILTGFAAHDLLDRLQADSDLLDSSLSAALQARLERRFVFGDQSWNFSSMRLFLASGIPHVQAIEPAVGELLRRLDGTRPLAAVIDSLAGAEQARREEIRSRFLLAVRHLIECGFLEAAPRC